MTRTISKSIGRGWLIALIMGGFLASLLSVLIIAINGGLNIANAARTFGLLLEIHLPLLVLIATYFKEHEGQRSRKIETTSSAALVFTTVAVGVSAVLLPLVLIWTMRTGDLEALMNVLKPFGGAFVLGLLGWYFSLRGTPNLPPTLEEGT